MISIRNYEKLSLWHIQNKKFKRSCGFKPVRDCRKTTYTRNETEEREIPFRLFCLQNIIKQALKFKFMEVILYG